MTRRLGDVPFEPVVIVRDERITFDPRMEGYWFVLRFVEAPDDSTREAIARAFEERVRGSFLDPERCEPWLWSGRAAVLCMQAREGAPDAELDDRALTWPVWQGQELVLDPGNTLGGHLGRILEAVHRAAPIEEARYSSDGDGEVDASFEAARAEAREALAMARMRPVNAPSDGPALSPVPKGERPSFPAIPKWFASQKHSVDDVALLPDGRILVIATARPGSGFNDKAAYVFETPTSEPSSKSDSFPVGNQIDQRAAVHPSGRRVIVSSTALVEVDIDSGAVRNVWAPDDKPIVYENGGVNRNCCSCAAWLDERRLIVTTAIGLRILEQRGEGFEVKARGPRGDGGHVVATNDGRLVLVSVRWDGKGRLFGVDGNRVVELAKFKSMKSPRALGGRLFGTVKAVLHEIVGGEVAWERAFRGPAKA